MRSNVSGLMLLLTLIFHSTVLAENIFSKEKYRSFVEDERAASLGDMVTVIVVESSQGVSSNDYALGRDIGVSAGYSVTNDQDDAALTGSIDVGADKQVGRSGSLLAELSATVTRVDEFGRLYIKGRQQIEINGDEQYIVIEGWLRAKDIDSQNKVRSSRLSDAKISYTGRSESKKGFFSRFFSWFGF
jgi:flagellar L-ring protein precursor FlgH